MVKIKCSITEKDKLLSKSSALVENLSSISSEYNNISVPEDFDGRNHLLYINKMLTDIERNANLINQMLEKYLYKMEDIQGDLLEVASELSEDNLSLFNNNLLSEDN